MTADQITNFTTTNSNTSYLEGYCTDVNGQKVDITVDPVVLVDKNISKDWTRWMRERRNSYLTACDWTQAADSPLTDTKKAEWQTYRQQLRELPTNYTGTIASRDDVTWPVQP